MHPSIFALGLVSALIVGAAQPGISTESQATMQQPHLIIFKDLPCVVRKGAYSYDRKLLKGKRRV